METILHSILLKIGEILKNYHANVKKLWIVFFVQASLTYVYSKKLKKTKQRLQLLADSFHYRCRHFYFFIIDTPLWYKNETLNVKICVVSNVFLSLLIVQAMGEGSKFWSVNMTILIKGLCIKRIWIWTFKNLLFHQIKVTVQCPVYKSRSEVALGCLCLICKKVSRRFRPSPLPVFHENTFKCFE